MRALSNKNVMDKAFVTLKGKAKVKRTMWSRRAQEYEAKINSGNLISLAEVVRDLHRSGDQTEQSYSERQIYESAISRLAREVAAVEDIAEKGSPGKSWRPISRLPDPSAEKEMKKRGLSNFRLFFYLM